MLIYNNQIFRNCFVIIHCHLTKISARINKCKTFEPNKLSITLSTLWCNTTVFFIAVECECCQDYRGGWSSAVAKLPPAKEITQTIQVTYGNVLVILNNAYLYCYL